MTVPIVTLPMRRAADALLVRADSWVRGIRVSDGLAFVTFTSASKPGVLYFASERGCTCPGYQHRGCCCHVIAVAEDADRRSVADSVTVSAPGAAQTVTDAPLRRYEDLFPACPCGDVADSRDGLCDRCASEREYQQRMAVKSTARATEAWL